MFKKEVVCRYGAHLRKDDAIFMIKHCRVIIIIKNDNNNNNNGLY